MPCVRFVETRSHPPRWRETVKRAVEMAGIDPHAVSERRLAGYWVIEVGCPDEKLDDLVTSRDVLAV